MSCPVRAHINRIVSSVNGKRSVCVQLTSPRTASALPHDRQHRIGGFVVPEKVEGRTPDRTGPRVLESPNHHERSLCSEYTG